MLNYKQYMSKSQQPSNFTFDQKPSKLQRAGNHKHKQQQLKQFTKLLKWEQCSKNHTEALTRFNFKKTTAFKKKYSCHGYGGKCGMCSSNHKEFKKYSKEETLYSEGNAPVYFVTKNVTY